MIENQNAVRYIFFQSVARERAFSHLSRDDGGDTGIFQPVKKAAQFGAHNAVISQAKEEELNGIQKDALGLDLLNGGPQANEQTFKIVFTGFFNLLALNVDVVNCQFFLADQCRQVIAERGHVGDELLGRFFHGNADARLVIKQCAARQEFKSKQRLAGTRTAADERSPARGKATMSYLIKAADAGWA